MIKQEYLENDLVRTYSDLGVYIHGGFPESDYEEAIDPVSANRTYTETNTPIVYEENDLLDNEYAIAGKIFLGVSE